jgi:hypothetical protein
MNEQERAYFLAFADEYEKKMKGNPELARRFLINMGLYTEDLELTEPYKHLSRTCTTTETV